MKIEDSIIEFAKFPFPSIFKIAPTTTPTKPTMSNEIDNFFMGSRLT